MLPESEHLFLVRSLIAPSLLTVPSSCRSDDNFRGEGRGWEPRPCSGPVSRRRQAPCPPAHMQLGLHPQVRNRAPDPAARGGRLVGAEQCLRGRVTQSAALGSVTLRPARRGCPGAGLHRVVRELPRDSGRYRETTDAVLIGVLAGWKAGPGWKASVCSLPPARRVGRPSSTTRGRRTTHHSDKAASRPVESWRANSGTRPLTAST